MIPSGTIVPVVMRVKWQQANGAKCSTINIDIVRADRLWLAHLRLELVTGGC